MVNAIDPSAVAEAYQYAADNDVPIVNLYGLDENATSSITFDEIRTGEMMGAHALSLLEARYGEADRGGRRAARHPRTAGERPARPGLHRLRGGERRRGRRRPTDELASGRGVGDDGELAHPLPGPVDGLRAQRHARGAGDEHRRTPGPAVSQRRRPSRAGELRRHVRLRRRHLHQRGGRRPDVGDGPVLTGVVRVPVRRARPRGGIGRRVRGGERDQLDAGHAGERRVRRRDDDGDDRGPGQLPVRRDAAGDRR